jgi:hypothetical protein
MRHLDMNILSIPVSAASFVFLSNILFDVSDREFYTRSLNQW